MDKVNSFQISISSTVPAYERGMLEATIKDVASVQSQKTRAFGIDDYVIIVAAIGGTAAAVKEMGELANKILEWRRNLRRKSIQPEVELQSNSKEPLNIDSATDEEIREWFSQ